MNGSSRIDPPPPLVAASSGPLHGTFVSILNVFFPLSRARALEISPRRDFLRLFVASSLPVRRLIERRRHIRPGKKGI
jgi:hypothetical protein